jgi:quinone-modifying oxidoreductase subunit QmoA
MRVNYDILVIGGGISGITAALEAAETGFRVLLIEKGAYLGGQVAGMNQYFPKLCPPYCGLEINFRRIRENPNIDLQTSARVETVEGGEGNFQVELETLPTHVNEHCTSCGECALVCPIERPDPFNQGMSRTKAIYHPHDLAFPSRFTIDHKVCLKEDCGKCVNACKYQAIDLNEKSRELIVYASAIVIATGWKLYDATKLTALKFGIYPDVITSMTLERMAAPNGTFHGKVVRPSNGETPANIAFVQCAGSRDENHLPYCSGICCSASMKQALFLAEKYPETRIRIHYIDLRVMGRNEDFLNKVENHPGIELIKGKIAAVTQSENGEYLILEAENIMSGKKETTQADLVILALGIQPNPIGLKDVIFDESGFVSPDHLIPGIYATGCCRKPMDVSMSVKDATGTALKAIQSVVKTKVIQ